MLMWRSGVNAAVVRLRAINSLTAISDDKPQWTTSGAWLERDLTRWQSELTLGDTFTSGDVFDAVQFQGISLASSDAMLPDSQKGFAPTIRGIARTNAQVTVRQNGYVLYQTYVTPGAFVIDDLYPTASSGNLEVAVKESDGEIRRFTQPYASVTSMQREGSLKYNLVAGRYHSDDASQRPLMMQLSLMRGFAHNLTLFGGLQSQTAVSLGFDPSWMAAANVCGAGIGKMVCPQSIAIGAGAIGAVGSESKILGAVVKYFALFVVLAGAICYAGVLVGI